MFYFIMQFVITVHSQLCIWIQILSSGFFQEMIESYDSLSFLSRSF